MGVNQIQLYEAYRDNKKCKIYYGLVSKLFY